MSSSLRADAGEWIVERIRSEMTYLADVELLARPEDLGTILRAKPSIGVIILSGENSGEDTPFGTDLVYFTAGLWLVCDAFTHDDILQETDGAYAILDDIHEALAFQLPTGCDIPLVYQSDALEDLADGVLQWSVEYTFGIVLESGEIS